LGHFETVLAVVVGVYVAGVILLTLAARWWKGFRVILSGPFGGSGDTMDVAMAISMWPLLTPMFLIMLSISIPAFFIFYFLPED